MTHDSLIKRTAFASWDNRIAPVFDTAQSIHIVSLESGRIVSETEEELLQDLPDQKAHRLVALGVGTLVCGAISRPVYGLTVAFGIEVIPFVAGDLREVIQAWMIGNLNRAVFTMPGCCSRSRHFYRMMTAKKQEIKEKNGRGRGGAGKGGGQGQGGGGQGLGRGGQGQGRMGGPLSAGADGNCLCPKCGYKEPHVRGVPCVQKQCPECGTILVRE